jgi:hypothetical protein
MEQKYFYKKTEALQYINQFSNDNDLHLYSEDISADNKKRFFATDYNSLYKICINNNKNFYENIEKNEEVKLHLDIDLKKNKVDKFNVDNLIKEITDLINTKLKEYDIDDPQIIILSATTDLKISLHIIYVNIVFDDIYKIKYFMQEIKSPFITDKIVDLSIYRTGCFRLLWSSKINKNNKLVYYTGINYKYTNNKKLFFDCLVKNISEDNYFIDYNMPIIKIKTKIKTKIKSSKSHDIFDNKINYVSIDILQQLVDCIDIKRADNYKDWLDIGMILYDSNSGSFNIWHEWSKQSSQYNNSDECISKWNSFDENKNNKLTIGTLKMYAKMDNPIEYSYINFVKNKNNDNLTDEDIKEYTLNKKLEFKNEFKYSLELV